MGAVTKNLSLTLHRPHRQACRFGVVLDKDKYFSMSMLISLTTIFLVFNVKMRIIL